MFLNKFINFIKLTKRQQKLQPKRDLLRLPSGFIRESSLLNIYLIRETTIRKLKIKHPLSKQKCQKKTKRKRRKLENCFSIEKTMQIQIRFRCHRW